MTTHPHQMTKHYFGEEKICKNRIGEFFGPYMILHHDKRANIVSIVQDMDIKRYCSLQISPLQEQSSIFYDSIDDRKIAGSSQSSKKAQQPRKYVRRNLFCTILSQNHLQKNRTMIMTMMLEMSRIWKFSKNKSFPSKLKK